MADDLDVWLNTARIDTVLRAETIVSDRVGWVPLRTLLIPAVRATCMARMSRLGCIDLPLLITSAIRGESDDKDVDLAAICLLAYVAANALDDIMDNDPTSVWPDIPRGEVLLAATTLIGAIVPMALSTLSETAASPGLLAAYGDFFVRMSAGQLEDLRARGPVDPTAAFRIAGGKSGEFTAAVASMAARLARATNEQLEIYVEMARILGTAQQIFSDYMDLLQGSSRDAARGLWTVPISLHHQLLPEVERDEFPHRYPRSGDEDTNEGSGGFELDGNGLHEGAILLELQRAQGLVLLEEAGPSEPAGEGIRRMFDASSPLTLLDKRGGGHGKR